MKTRAALVLLAAIAFAPAAHAQALTEVSLRQAVPSDAFMAVSWRHNPERDYQRAHIEEVWNTFQQENLYDRVLDLVKQRAPEEELEKVNAVVERLKTAVAPASLDALWNAEELVYAQVMQMPTSQQLVAIRMSEDGADGYYQAAKNLLEILQESAEDQVRTAEETVDGVTYLTLYPPQGAPVQPTLAKADGVLLFATTNAFARQAVAQMRGEGAESKFDDPRFQAALAELPEPEDCVVIYDGRTHFAQLRGMSDFIRQQAQGQEEALRVARLLEVAFDEFGIIDYEVTVEYTDGNRNLTQSVGRLLPESKDKVLYQMIASGKPFAEWQTWVPAGALNYSLSTGVDLHPLYMRVVEIATQEAPEETAQVLAKLAEFEEQYGVRLDEDVLQAFSGESVSVTLPGGQSVTALRCRKPERTRELLHELVEFAKTIPAVQAQQFDMVECESLEGFDEMRAGFLAMTGAKPVVGFREGWMIIATTPAAAQEVIDSRWGDAENIAQTEAFKQFDLEIEGEVASVSYANIAENIRNTAAMINQAAAMAPMFIGMAAADADPDDVKLLTQAVGLLPSVAKIVEKFDFMQAQLSVTEPGDEEGTYTRRSVMLIEETEAASAPE